MKILFRVRNKEKQAVAREIESWKKKHVQAMMAGEVEDLVHDALANREADERFLKRVLQDAVGEDKERIDEANEFAQEYCEQSIGIHDLIRSLINMVHQTGHPIELAAELDQATEAYQRWKEDFPELLAMGYTPLGNLVRDRIKQALRNDAPESNWQEFFSTRKNSPDATS